VQRRSAVDLRVDVLRKHGRDPDLDPRDVDAVPLEQLEPVGEAVPRRPAPLAGLHLRRGLHRVAETSPPRSAVGSAEAEAEQQLEVLGARGEHPV
jgi:hypothetical protein